MLIAYFIGVAEAEFDFFVDDVSFSSWSYFESEYCFWFDSGISNIGDKSRFNNVDFIFTGVYKAEAGNFPIDLFYIEN